jgi:serine/threonine-protein kinase
VTDEPKQSFAAGLVGIVLDERYRLDALLGEGGMGAVYRATHLAMDRKVAVKLLKPHLSGDDVALERFAREARATLKVDSPHAVKVLDFGITPHRDYYMVLEYLDGRTVQRELEIDGPFAPARVLHVAKQVLAALGAAHATGLVHRDIKPDNILLTRVGDDADFTTVLDFGVAKLMEGHARSARSQLALTQAGMVFGTPEFMAPEQACGQPLDGRADLYGLAATMFAMLTGCGMYEASSAIDWLVAHARQPPPHLADALPALAKYPELDRALQRCLAKRRDDRPRDAAAMVALLDEVAPTLAADYVAPRAPAHPPTASSGLRAITAAPSSYVHAIVDPASQAAAMIAPSTTGFVPPAARARRTMLILAIGGLVIVVLLVVAIVMAMRPPGATSTLPVTTRQPIVRPARDAASAPVPKLVEVPADAPPPESPPVDAGVAPPHRPTAPSPPPELVQHLAAAEAAAREHSVLTQLVQAEAALRIDPRNVRARYLAGDALLLDGDLERGCKYLRMIKRNPEAASRARSAGCPTD